MAVGLLRPDGGRCEVFGVDVWSDPVRAKTLLGVLPDGLSMPERLTGRELLTFTGQLRGIEPAELTRRVDELLEVMQLTEAERTLVVDYSTGMRKKIGLATALLHRPRLLVLDEPFEAVDPVSAVALKTILQRFVASGGSAVLSSHVMPLVEQLCDTVAVMAAWRRGGRRDAGRGTRRQHTRGGLRPSRRGRGEDGRGPVMAGVLIRMKLRLIRNSMTGGKAVWMVTGAILGLMFAAATVALAFVRLDTPGLVSDLLAVTFLIWTLGWMVGPLWGGSAVLRNDHFALLPLPRRGLALGLLAAAFVGITTVVTALAFLGLVVHGIRSGLGPALVSVPAAAAQLVFVVLLSRVTHALFGAVAGLPVRCLRDRPAVRGDAGAHPVRLDARGGRRRVPGDRDRVLRLRVDRDPFRPVRVGRGRRRRRRQRRLVAVARRPGRTRRPVRSAAGRLEPHPRPGPVRPLRRPRERTPGRPRARRSLRRDRGRGPQGTADLAARPAARHHGGHAAGLGPGDGTAAAHLRHRPAAALGGPGTSGDGRRDRLQPVQPGRDEPVAHPHHGQPARRRPRPSSGRACCCSAR